MLFYYPNRPILIPPDEAHIRSLEATGDYIAEKKWNGDNITLNTDTMGIRNRYNQPHRFVPDEIMREELSQWPKHACINAELMNYKTKDTKNLIIAHCVMAWRGKPLIGKTWGDSRKILEDMPSGISVQVNQVYESGFWDLFQTADGKTIEGIILKKPAGKLIFSTTPIADVPWMLKVRKPCKKYQF